MSGLIFVALAVVWAAVLIPKALRHHDELARTRPVEEVSPGVRVVVPRATAPAAPVSRPAAASPVPAPRDPSPVRPAPVPASLPAPSLPDVPAQRTRSAVAAHRQAAAAAARRRRRVLAALLLVSAGVGVAAWLGHLQPWAPAVPLGITLAFLVLARVLVRRERRRWESLLSSLRTPGPASAAVTFEPDPALLGGGPAEEDAVAPVAPPVTAPAAPAPDPAPDPAPAAATGLWDPLPVTLPTYVGKAPAPRTVRTIDLGAAGVSSAGRDAAGSALAAEAATAPGAVDDVEDTRAVAT